MSRRAHTPRGFGFTSMRCFTMPNRRLRSGGARVWRLWRRLPVRDLGEAALVALMARNEKAPATDLERFFPVLKNMTLDAFIVSEIGMKEYLGYKGNTAIQDFPGCTHPDHQRF